MQNTYLIIKAIAGRYYPKGNFYKAELYQYFLP